MSDDDTQEIDGGSDSTLDVATNAASSNYKVLGYNKNQGTTYGVLGQVDSSDGYGLYSPDDVKIEGLIDTATTPFRVETGTTSTTDSENVILGHASNSTGSNTVGATIAGGGQDDGTNDNSHLAEDYGTVGGGLDNNAGTYATISGGWRNTAATLYGTIGGGFNNSISTSYGTVGGGRRNTASGKFSTVAGGGPSDTNNASSTKNEAAGDYSNVGGGGQNTAYGEGGTVAGGMKNQAGKSGTIETEAFVGGGTVNEARATQSGIAAGFQNAITEGSLQAFIGGGYTNDVSAERGMIPGGQDNAVSAKLGFACGYGAEANNSGAFVWADDQAGDSFRSDIAYASDNGDPTGANTFSARSYGGVRFVTGSGKATYISSGSTGWANSSSRAVKTNVDPVDPTSVLDGVTDLDVATWQYEDADGEGAGEVHLGPMAEDFHDAFDVGNSDSHINSINADGVALAAIQGLDEKLDEKDDELAAQDERIERLEAENETLRERLAALEQAVDGPETGSQANAAD